VNFARRIGWFDADGRIKRRPERRVITTMDALALEHPEEPFSRYVVAAMTDVTRVADDDVIERKR
jgi:hypothetical protein